MSTPAPVVNSLVNAGLVLVIVVSLPYSKAEFDDSKQASYKIALATAAGTTASNIVIVSITEGRRSGAVAVETKILANDASEVATLTNTLGTGNVLKARIDSGLKAQGLKESTSVTKVDPLVSEAGTAQLGSSEQPQTDDSTKGDSFRIILITGIVGGTLLCILASYLIMRRHRVQNMQEQETQVQPTNSGPRLGTMNTTLPADLIFSIEPIATVALPTGQTRAGHKNATQSSGLEGGDCSCPGSSITGELHTSV